MEVRHGSTFETQRYRVVRLGEVLSLIRDALFPDGRDIERVGDVVLMPHQREAVRILRASIMAHGGAILADPVGTGKTWSALGVATLYERVLIVAPASLRTMWRHALSRARRSIEFVTYESLSRSKTAYSTHTFDLVIADEAHHVRNAATRRFKAMAALCWGADLLLLSATPIHNRPDELRALASFFLGSGAWTLTPELLGRLVCRRSETTGSPLPRASPLEWISVPDSNDILQDLLALPPPVAPSDGEQAVVLGTYVLVRQWCSSDAALVAALERRLVAGEAISHRLAQGQLPSRRELTNWMADSSAVQLTFDLDAPDKELGDLSRFVSLLRDHLAAVRNLRERVKANMQRDASRAASLLKVLSAGHRAILFTHSADTARMWFKRLMHQSRVALLDGRGARIASGRINRDEIVAAFHPETPTRRERQLKNDPMRIDTLVATDVLSEGVGLHDADLVFHLDLPWTVARMEQRVGRLRRIGSPHREVLQFAFEPPGSGNGAIRLLERLRRKARLSQMLIGSEDSGLSLSASSERAETSPSAAQDQLVQLARGWPRIVRQPRTHDPILLSACLSSDPSKVGFLAVCSEGSVLSIVGEMDGDLATSPADVLRLARIIGPAVAVPTTHADSAIALLNERLNARKADAELLGGTSRQSQVHRKLLRLLHSLLRSEQRGTRARLGAIADSVRDTLSRTRGVGSEHFLEGWLERHQRPAIADLQSLTQFLEQRTSKAPLEARETSVKALLLILPTGEPQ